MFRASKAKTPVMYSKNGLRAPRNTKKAHCKGVFFFKSGFRSGKPCPGFGLFFKLLVPNPGPGWKGLGPDESGRDCVR